MLNKEELKKDFFYNGVVIGTTTMDWEIAFEWFYSKLIEKETNFEYSFNEEEKVLNQMDEFYKNISVDQHQKIIDEINKSVVKTEGITFEDYLKSLQPSPSFTIVSCDDWQVLYVNGIKRRENHSLSTSDLAEYIDIKKINIELTDEEKDKFTFPEHEEDLIK